MSGPAFDPAQFSHTSSSDGYMLYYRGKPLGGASVQLPRIHRRVAHSIRKDAAMFSENAQRQISELKSGAGEARFWTCIHEIEAAHKTGGGK